MKRIVEVFTSGCLVCEPIVKMVNELACESCDVQIYNLVELCEDEVCINKVKSYGVQRIPAIAVNGQLLDCCRDLSITKEALIQAGVGQA